MLDYLGGEADEFIFCQGGKESMHSDVYWIG